jgi:CubicO group peptidase (beta-lactamase class C family)
MNYHHDTGSDDYLNSLLSKHNVQGLSIARLEGTDVTTLCAGLSNRDSKIPMVPSTWLQQASLSKTIAAAFAVSYYTERGISMSSKVTDVLRRLKSSFQLDVAPGVPKSWLEELKLYHLVNHTGLGLHYVPGVPLVTPFPPVIELLQGQHEDDLGYPKIVLEKRPGTQFGYSGAGFMLLQHILETEHDGKPIDKILSEWLVHFDVKNDEIGFDQNDITSSVSKPSTVEIAHGYLEDGTEVEGKRLMFPPLAAGGHGTPRGLCTFLYHLARAYHMPPGKGSGAIMSEHVHEMLDHSVDLGCFEFMYSKMGLGVFVTKAGPNRFMLHQAANDGFRGLFLVCFDGPDAGRGFVVLSNGNNNAMFLNAEISTWLCKSMRFQGMDWSLLTSRVEDFDIANMKQEEIVNLGIKDLVLKAFVQVDDTSCSKL